MIEHLGEPLIRGRLFLWEFDAMLRPIFGSGVGCGLKSDACVCTLFVDEKHALLIGQAPFRRDLLHAQFVAFRTHSSATIELVAIDCKVVAFYAMGLVAVPDRRPMQVFFKRYRFEVGRINTKAVSAEMVNSHSQWN